MRRLRARSVLLAGILAVSLGCGSEEAARLGLDSFFDSHKGQTGTIAVLDGTTHESLAVFRGEMDLDRYQTVLDELRDPGGA